MPTLAEVHAEAKRKQQMQTAIFARLRAFGQEIYGNTTKHRLAQTIGELEEIAADVAAQREAWYAELKEIDDEQAEQYQLQLLFENEAEAMLQPLYALLDHINEVQRALLQCENDDIEAMFAAPSA